LAGKRRKHKPKYRPKDKPRVRQPELVVQPTQPAFSEPPRIVFVSSLIDKMRNERAAVEHAVRSIPITQTWKFEDTPPHLNHWKNLTFRKYERVTSLLLF
jgi:hypothetical protein